MEARNRLAWREDSDESGIATHQEEHRRGAAERVVPLRRRTSARRRAAETPMSHPQGAGARAEGENAATVVPASRFPQAPAAGGAVDAVIGPARPAPVPADETATRQVPATSGDRGMVVPPGLAELLRERQAELQAKLARLDAEAQEVDEDSRPRYSNHPADEAVELLDRAGRDAVARVLMDDMAQVDRALDRLANGTYGLCEDCHQPIPPKRLEARPTATLCVNCQSKREGQAARVRPYAH
jgi:RNA polymerase-binding protein DksA